MEEDFTGVTHSLLTLFRFPVSLTMCCGHPFWVQICLSTTMVTAAGDTSRSDSEGSGLNISELKGTVGVGRFRKQKGLQAHPA